MAAEIFRDVMPGNCRERVREKKKEIKCSFMAFAHLNYDTILLDAITNGKESISTRSCN